MPTPESRRDLSLEELFLLAKEGDETALAQIWARVYHWIRQTKVGPAETQEDEDFWTVAYFNTRKKLTQEIHDCKFVWKGIEQFRGRVWKVCKNEYRTAIRKDSRIQKVDWHESIAPTPKESVEASAEEVQRRSLIEQLSDAPLSENEQRVVELIFLVAQSICDTPCLHEIARVLFGEREKDGEVKACFTVPKGERAVERIADQVSWRLYGSGISRSTLSRIRRKVKALCS